MKDAKRRMHRISINLIHEYEDLLSFTSKVYLHTSIPCIF